MAYRGDDLTAFMRDIAGLAADEARKAKVLYLRNGITELGADFDNARSFSLFMLLFALIPFFWPVLYIQRRMMVTDGNAKEMKLRNALEVWRGDLGGEAAALESQLTKVAVNKPRLVPWPPRIQRSLPPAS